MLEIFLLDQTQKIRVRTTFKNFLSSTEIYLYCIHVQITIAAKKTNFPSNLLDLKKTTIILKNNKIYQYY